MFPELTDPQQINVRLKNLEHKVYLCVKDDSEGNHILSTKTETTQVDPERDFSLYYFTSAEFGETKMVLPVHQTTKLCLKMTSDAKLETAYLTDTMEKDGLEKDPMKFTLADSRFFYIKTSGGSYALEAMNGEQRYYFLCVQDTGDNKFKIDIKHNEGENYPDDILFDIQEAE